MKKSVFFSALVASTLAYSTTFAAPPEPGDDAVPAKGCWSRMGACMKRTRAVVEAGADAVGQLAHTVSALSPQLQLLGEIVGIDGKVISTIGQVAQWADLVQNEGIPLIKRLAETSSTKDVSELVYAGLKTMTDLKSNNDNNWEDQILSGIKTFQDLLRKIDTGNAPEATAFIAKLDALKSQTEAALAQARGETQSMNALITEISVSSANLTGKKGGTLTTAFPEAAQWAALLAKGTSLVQSLGIRSTDEIVAELTAIKSEIASDKDSETDNPQEQVLDTMKMFDYLISQANTAGNTAVTSFMKDLSAFRKTLQKQQAQMAVLAENGQKATPANDDGGKPFGAAGASES